MTLKNLAVAAVVLSTLLPLRADEFIRNGDFSDGLAHWYGDVKTPADIQSGSGSEMSMTPTTDAASTVPKLGLVIKLKDHDWTKATQDFSSKGAVMVVTFTYTMTPDTKFSDDPEDYKNVTGSIGFNAWLPIRIPANQWMMFFSDIGAGHGTYFPMKPKFGSAEPITFTETFDHQDKDTHKSITFAFPPGKGLVTLTNVSATSGSK